jgi:predicted DNA-binding protein (UPF0251 family)
VRIAAQVAQVAMCYNSSCLDEQNTGALCFSEAAGFSHNPIIAGKAPSKCGLTSLAVRLGNGSALGGRFAMITDENFWSRVEKADESHCWEWQGRMSTNGYGRYYANRKAFWAHRYSYEQVNGKIPEGREICHKCDNKKCVNPNHLYAGTHSQNMRDAHERGQLRGYLSDEDKQEICRLYSTGEYSEQQLAERYGVARPTIARVAISFLGSWSRSVSHRGYCKLTPQEVIEIRRLGETGMDQTEIAERFGIRRPHANRIINRKVWVNIL